MPHQSAPAIRARDTSGSVICECKIVAPGVVQKRRHKVAELPNHIARHEPSITHKNRNETVLLNKKNS